MGETYGSLIQHTSPTRMVNLGFFREHRLPLPIPKKPLKLCPLQKMAERALSDAQRGCQ
jgi:hypothetical protein